MKKICVVALVALLPTLMTGCQVMRGERSVAEYNHDSNITAAVKYKLVKSDEISASRVHVETDKGVVLLSGFVKNNHQKEVATNLAQSVKGVKHVKNSLVPYKEAHSKKAFYKAKRKLNYD